MLRRSWWESEGFPIGMIVIKWALSVFGCIPSVPLRMCLQISNPITLDTDSRVRAIAAFDEDDERDHCRENAIDYN